jgi:hypothetical protein
VEHEKRAGDAGGAQDDEGVVVGGPEVRPAGHFGEDQAPGAAGYPRGLAGAVGRGDGRHHLDEEGAGQHDAEQRRSMAPATTSTSVQAPMGTRLRPTSPRPRRMSIIPSDPPSTVAELDGIKANH